MVGAASLNGLMFRFARVDGGSDTVTNSLTGVEARLKALMLRALDGDSAAQGQLLSALSGYLRAFFARRLGQGASDIEDLVQETLLAIHLKRASYDRGQPFTPWAYGVARYKLLDHFRRVGSRAEAPLEDAGALFAADDASPREARRDLGRLLESLPERQRNLVRDVKITGLSIEEASQKSGMSASAVKVSIHRAIQAMARRARDAN
jgi:RNA polymerase sigma-70 factor (ECF subfamily)